MSNPFQSPRSQAQELPEDDNVNVQRNVKAFVLVLLCWPIVLVQICYSQAQLQLGAETFRGAFRSMHWDFIAVWLLISSAVTVVMLIPFSFGMVRKNAVMYLCAAGPIAIFATLLINGYFITASASN